MGAGHSSQKLAEVNCRTQEQYLEGGVSRRLGKEKTLRTFRPARKVGDTWLKERWETGTLTTLSLEVKLQA